MSIWDDLGDAVDDVVDAAEDVADGLASAASSLFEGAAPLVGVLTSGAAIFIAGPAYVVPAFVAGAAGSRLLIRHRHMRPDERAFAEALFGKTLPPNDRIVLTNLGGLGGAKFVMPSVNGQILVNLASDDCYERPTTYEDKFYPAPGKVFIHELVHVWQIHKGSYFPRLCDRVAGAVTGAEYKPPADLRQPWPALSLEQEATVVDEWFAPTTRGPAAGVGHARQPTHPYFAYVNEVIRGGDMPVRVAGHDIFGAIVVRWRRLGGEAGFLGLPLGGEMATRDGGGRMQRFAGGVIVWHPGAGAFSVRGAILQRWLAIGDVRFGYPTTDELATPDGAGRFNHFKLPDVAGAPESSIYWTQSTGAVEVYGAIRARWAALGWERSGLRYPVAPEEAEGADRKQRFGGGLLVWRQASGAVEQLPPQPFIGTFPTVRVRTPAWLYAIGDDGSLTWRALDAAAGGRPGTWRGPRVCGSGWGDMRHVVAGGGAAIYAVTSDGGLRWYRHDGFNDGAFQWTGGGEVNTGWHIFERLIGGGNGILYGVEADGTLRWYRDHGYLSGSGTQTIMGGTAVGSGWTMYPQVFSGGDGVLYGIDPEGDLFWYRHEGFMDGSATWHGRVKVGHGWGDFVTVFGAGDGIVFALTRDNRLLRYQHTGWKNGGKVETWVGPLEVAHGLGNVARMFALLSSTEAPVVR